MRFIILILAAFAASAQTTHNNVARGPVDFSGAASTRPMKVGTSLPATCAVGEVFFKSDAAAGQNVYLCTATNTWTLLSAGGGLADGLTVTSTTSAITVASGGHCRIGNTRYEIPSAAVWTVSGSATGTVFVYCSIAGTTAQITVGTTAGVGSCDADCTSQTLSSSGFPAGSIPIATVAMTAGALSTTPVDKRDALSSYHLIAGTGLGKTTNADGSETLNVTAAYVDTTDTRLDVACQDAGSTDAYACTPSPTIAAYVTGGKYRVKANTANTGAATVNVNSLGAKTIKKMNNNLTTDLATGDVCAGQWIDMTYNGTSMMLDSPTCAAASAAITSAYNGTAGSTITCTGGSTWDSIGTVAVSVTPGKHVTFAGQVEKVTGSGAYDFRAIINSTDPFNTAGLGALTCNSAEKCAGYGTIAVLSGFYHAVVTGARPGTRTGPISMSFSDSGTTATIGWEVRCATAGDTFRTVSTSYVVIP